jgi:polyisoprenoid-binding protein YceI
MKRITLMAVLAFTAAAAQAATYKIDADHSTIGFKIHHFVGKVAGRFNKFEGTFDYDQADSKAWKTQATIDAASIDTSSAKREEHLRGADFFDVKKFPTLSFVSTGITDIQGTKAKLHGNLTMHGVTKAVVLDLETLGTAKDPWGNQRASFEANGTVNRKDFGIIWNKTLETGGLMLGEDVAISLDIEGVQQK